jgi:phage tail protein X
MSRDHPEDSDGPERPTARLRRHSLRVMHRRAEEAGQAALNMAPAMMRETSVTAQARDIIETVLADTDPGLADVQRSLRESMAVHAGSPSKALLAHLLETRRQTNAL